MNTVVPATDQPQSDGVSGVLRLCLLGLALLIALIALLFFRPDPAQNLAQAAATGADTSDYYARVDGVPVHCQGAEDANLCIEGSAERDAATVVLWLGNSQLHAINQWQTGEVSSAQRLHEKLHTQGRDLLVFSQPNANLQEHYALFEYLQARLPLSTLILPVVFDDTRESGLRPDIATLLADPAVASALGKTDIGQQLLNTAKLEKNGQSGDAPTWQERSEQWLDARLATHSEIWEQRAQYRASAGFALYRLRNSVLGISASSLRRKLPGRYQQNMDSLTALLAHAELLQLDVLVYIAPIRGDITTPYIPAEYAEFVLEVERLAGSYGARFANLEALVAPMHWGSTGSTSLAGSQTAGVDFMHFRASGHVLLAETLFDLLNDATQ